MLVKFSVGNYLSFKEIQTLSLIPESLKELEENLHTSYYNSPEDRLLKSVAIHGHNSHGKSNLLKAFKFFQNLVFSSFVNGQLNQTLQVEPFALNTSTKNLPTYFEIIFFIKDTKYRYRLILTSNTVISEELHYSLPRIRENFLFERTGQEIKLSKQWCKEGDNKIEQAIIFAKPHILFLSVLLSQENVPRVTEVGKWLSANIIIPDDYISELRKARAIYSNPNYRSLILKFIDAADLGFTTIFDKLDKIVKENFNFEKGMIDILYEREIINFELYTNHTVYNEAHQPVGKVELELQKNESAGTIKYFIIVCLLSYAIKHSQLIWVDELDSKFHSFLLEMLVSSFHNPEINPINSQLIFTTHSTVLLDQKLRRDQIVIVEKNEWGESTLSRIHTPENPIRIGKSIEREYRRGKLGGVSKKIKNNPGPTLFD